MDIRKDKDLLRQRIKERMEKLSAQDLAAESRSLSRRLGELLPSHVRVLCAYYPLHTEADLRSLMLALLNRGDELYLPRFAEKKLTFHRAMDLDHLVLGELKIKEPSRQEQPLDPLRLDLALIPGRAFDVTGHRLGRGNGGYDVWIRAQRAHNPKTLFWGVALECQIAREVPHEPHDEKMDAIITSRGILGAVDK